MWIRSAVVLAFLLAGLSSPAGAVIDSNLATEANGGGCHPTGFNYSILDQLTLINPEWAPVEHGATIDSGPVTIKGEVEEMHGDRSGDFPSSHVRADVNHFIRLDAEDTGRLADGNVEEDGRLHTEWEAGFYPAWAWAGPGDRMYAMGRFIFDCGHPGAEAGHCSTSSGVSCTLDADCRPPTCASCGAGETCQGAMFGYSSELHPPQATAAIRRGRGAVVSGAANAKPVLATRADIFASAAGGGAGDRCVLTHQAAASDQLSVNCWPLTQPVAQLNAADFHFDLPLPARPKKGHLSWRLTAREPPGGGPAARVRVKRHMGGSTPHLEVIVRLSRKVGGALPTGYAGTIDAGWRNDRTPLTHVRVTIEGVEITNALQPAAPSVPRTCSIADTPCVTAADCPSGEQCFGLGPVKSWRGQVAVNGEFQEFTGLETVAAGDVKPQQLVFDQYLRSDASLVLYADTRAHECIDSMYGKPLSQGLMDLGLSKGLQCLATNARNPGEVNATYPGPDFGAGTGGTTSYQTVSGAGDGGHCSLSTSLPCTVDADCPGGETCPQTGGALTLHYRIERLSS